MISLTVLHFTCWIEVWVTSPYFLAFLTQFEEAKLALSLIQVELYPCSVIKPSLLGFGLRSDMLQKLVSFKKNLEQPVDREYLMLLSQY